jgi:hypothetical protein
MRIDLPLVRMDRGETRSKIPAPLSSASVAQGTEDPSRFSLPGPGGVGLRPTPGHGACAGKRSAAPAREAPGERAAGAGRAAWLGAGAVEGLAVGAAQAERTAPEVEGVTARLVVHHEQRPDLLDRLLSRREALGAGRLVALLQDEHGDDHPETLIAQGFLLNVYVAQGRLSEAEQIGLAVLAGARKVLGALRKNNGAIPGPRRLEVSNPYGDVPRRSLIALLAPFDPWARAWARAWARELEG